MLDQQCGQFVRSADASEVTMSKLFGEEQNLSILLHIKKVKEKCLFRALLTGPFIYYVRIEGMVGGQTLFRKTLTFQYIRG